MIRRTVLLTKIALKNTLQLNEIKHTRDKKKKRRTITVLAAYAVLMLMTVAYVAIACIGLSEIGMSRIIPAVTTGVISLTVFAFTLFMAGGALFNLNTYVRLISLPIKPSEIIASRFLTMYAINGGLALLELIPAIVIYVWKASPNFLQCAMLVIGSVLTPLIPMAVASILGAAAYALFARFRFKNILQILFMLLVLGVNFSFGFMAPEIGADIRITDFVGSINGLLGRYYPPAGWLSDGVLTGDWGSFLLFLAVSLLLFAVFVALVSVKFTSICELLSAHAARRRFTLGEQRRKPPILALYRRELKGYISSGVYATNTIVGPIMAVVASIVIVTANAGELIMMIAGGIIGRVLPFALSVMANLSPTTSSSISLEGKQWWIARSIPVSAKEVFDAKILVQLTVSLPLLAVASLVLTIWGRLSASAIAYVWLTPICFVLFSSVAGLMINAKLYIFDWESQTEVVKQSAAAGLSMLIGAFLPAIAAAMTFIPFFNADFVTIASSVLVLIGAAIIYRRICAYDLREIGE